MMNFVISLETEIKRREHIKNEFAKHNVQFNFFDALTPNLAQPFAQQLNLAVSSEDLTHGELACFMSHVSLWKKMLEENLSYIAIFEDDIYLGEDAALYLNDYSWINPEWDIIKIEAFAEKVFLDKSRKKLPVGERVISKLLGANLGTAGYILSNKGAEKYLNYIKNHKLIPLDQMIFNQYIGSENAGVYQMNPALCIQEMRLYPEKQTNLTSKLFFERKQRMKKNKKKGWGKLKLEAFRVFEQIKIFLFAQKIEFR